MRARGALLLASLLAATTTAASRTGSSFVRASDVSWDPQTETPEALRRAVRWKTLVGSDALPRRDVSFGELELAPGAIYPGHRHPAPEIYYVLQGRVEWTVGDETFVAEPGTTIWTPPDTLHRMVNLTDDVARAVWVWWAPGGDASALATGYELVEPVPAQPETARFPEAR